jgi:serine/threonine-protein kinase
VIAGKYKVVKLLGEGGMGAVFVAEQALGTTSRKVALKTLHRELSQDPKIRARFEREVATVASLEHPNTIRVFDFGMAEDGLLYIVMELAIGRTLSKVIETEGALAPERAAKIIEQVCGSLAEAHAQGIVHRDLKPDNIMLLDRAGQKDVVKVLDFGIAKNQEAESRGAKLTMQGTVLGTPPYMSPEQFTGAALDVRSDIYSLAVVTFEMLTGRLPFEAESAFEWATLHMTQEPPDFARYPTGERVPPAMREAVYRALRKIPSERFASVTEFAAAFSMPTSSRVAKTAGEFPQKHSTAEAMPAPASFVLPGSAMGQRPGGTQMGEAVPAISVLPSLPVHPTPVPYGAPHMMPHAGPHAGPQLGGYREPPRPVPAYAQDADDGGGSRKWIVALLSVLALTLVAGVVYGAGDHYGWFDAKPSSMQAQDPVPAPPPPSPEAPKPATSPSSNPPASTGPLATLVTPTPPAPPPPQPAKPNNPPPRPPSPQPPAPTPPPPTPTPQPPAPTPPPPTPTPVTPTPPPPSPKPVDPCVKAQTTTGPQRVMWEAQCRNKR